MVGVEDQIRRLVSPCNLCRGPISAAEAVVERYGPRPVMRLAAVALACLAVGGCADDSGRARRPVPVDAYGEDPFVDAGTRDAVCRGGEAANRAGRVALADYLAESWPDVLAVLGYECREVDFPTESYPDCDGEIEPDSSTCWSTHASGRAIDVVVGGDLNTPTADGVALGDRIVTAFLAEQEGVAHSLARITGVQQILWNDRCWTPSDRDVLAATEMERCGIPNHDNHVHLTLSNAGADGLTSWYRRE